METRTGNVSTHEENTIESPLSKSAADENFPVGSFLIARKLRPHIAVYYAFARAGDDIGDDPRLGPHEKILRLTALETALLNPFRAEHGTQKAVALHNSLKNLAISLERGRKLLDAFRQDAMQNRYETWAELIDYCSKSADPVGRYLLDLHKENPAAYHRSDALCTVLQILNHLQDCGKDKAELDRVYLPQQWMRAQGIDADILNGTHSPPGLRTVLDQCLEGCLPLLASARALPTQLKSRQLAAESTIIVNLAHRLHKRLKKGDPLAERVQLTKFDFLLAGLTGLLCYCFRWPKLSNT